VKIAFVEPKAPFVNFYSWAIKFIPLMGPVYLGTILKNEGHDVAIHNENFKEIDFSKIKDADVLGISMMTSTAPRGYEIAEYYRAANPKGKVIIGGSHATFLPEEAAQYADHVVIGEAESVISDLIRNGGEKIIQGSPLENLDELPFPDFSLIEGYGKRRPMTPVMTSRGCPYDCEFCSVTPMFGRRYRFRSTENIIEELSQHKHKRLFFYDDNFTANRKRTVELLNRMIELKLTPSWIAQVRVEVAKDEELVKLMAKAGGSRLCIGFESMDPEVLKRYNKKQTPEDVVNCVKVLHRHGIKVHGMFISDGYSDIYHKLGIDTLQLSILTPLLGSRLYTAIKDAKQLIVDKYPTDWKLFDGAHVVYWPDNLSPAELQRQTTKALKKFYSRVNIAKMFFSGRFHDFYLRHMGHSLISKWEAQNKEYLAKLKQAHPFKRSSGPST
jgi:hypothetical protein